MGTSGDLISRFGSLALSVLPWLAVGVLAAAAIQALVPERWVARLLGGRRGLAVAIATGALMPGCSRTTMPLAIGLRRMPGQRLGNLTALIFVAPLLSPITIALTWSVLGCRMTVARVIASLGDATRLGVLINRYERWFEPQPRPVPIMGGAVDDCSASGCESSESERGRFPLRRLAHSTLRITRRVLPYLIGGIALAALLSTAIPADTIPKLVGGTAGPLTYLVAGVAGAPLYVCQGGSPPHLRGARHRPPLRPRAHLSPRLGRHVPTHRHHVPRHPHTTRHLHLRPLLDRVHNPLRPLLPANAPLTATDCARRGHAPQPAKPPPPATRPRRSHTAPRDSATLTPKGSDV
jgi:uncharacterized protein